MKTTAKQYELRPRNVGVSKYNCPEDLKGLNLMPGKEKYLLSKSTQRDKEGTVTEKTTSW